ncbi:MAG: hypothetical protein HKM05_00645 [Spirochaetales bacterium]|nr:hypothetical protein [Spirochaetales bacterium]
MKCHSGTARRWAVLVLAFVTANAFSDELTLPLPAPDRPGGELFDTTQQNQERRVLTGFFLPAEGALTSLAPLTASWRNGRLLDSRGGSWLGPVPRHIVRVERPGFLPLGLRLLLVLTPERSFIAEMQILWKAWKDGTWSGQVVPGAIHGRSATKSEATRVITLLIEQGGTPIGLWGTKDSRGVRQVSLVLYELPQKHPTKATSSDQPPVPQAPLAPRAPRVPPVQLGDFR